MKSLAPLFGIMVIIGIIVKFFWWILGALILTGLFFLVRALAREDAIRRAATARRQAEIAARADTQHRWVLQGDDRGVYGDYPIPLIVKESLPSWITGLTSDFVHSASSSNLVRSTTRPQQDTKP
jgi:hypothetical protein